MCTAAGAINQNMPHRFGRRGKEVSSASPAVIFSTCELQVRIMNERRRLQSLARGKQRKFVGGLNHTLKKRNSMALYADCMLIETRLYVLLQQSHAAAENPIRPRLQSKRLDGLTELDALGGIAQLWMSN